VVLAPASHHYSWRKAVDLLGLGSDALVLLPLDGACRLDVEALRATLEALGREGRTIIACVGVVGTTEGGGVDPIDALLSLRDEYAARFGRWFFVHVDAAYGGYARALLRDERGALRPFEQVEAEGALTDRRVYDGMAAISRADAVTIDPHKLGFVPYPAGALVVRDGAFREATVCRADYVNQGHDDHLGGFILEGSKPGAAAAACWVAHRAVPLTVEGYGAILRDSFMAARGLAELLDGRLLGGGRYRCAVLTPPDLDVLLYAFAPASEATLTTINATTARVLSALPATGERDFALSSTSIVQGVCDLAARGLLERLGAPPGAWHPGGRLLLVRSAMMTPFVAAPHLKGFYKARLLEALDHALGDGLSDAPR
jgi:tyrosine decarboxylase